MQTNKTQVKYIRNISEWYTLLCEDRYIIHDIDFSINDVLIVYYSNHDTSFNGGNSNNNINVVLASFTTSQARLKLFDEMIKLNSQVIYHDTDSIIYSVKPGEYEPKLGNNLGDLTNEIPESKGGYIRSIVAPGPKNYALKMANG